MSRGAARVAYIAGVLAFALIAGCAAPGEPSPRRPIIPASITDLAAHQVGNAVVLTFSVPRQSTGHESLAEPPTIDVYRAALFPGAAADRKTPWRLVYTIPSEQVDTYINGEVVEFRDPLAPGDAGQTAGSSLTYMI